MQKEIDLVLSPKEASNKKYYTQVIANKLEITAERISSVKILRRSVDARKKDVKVRLKVLVIFDEPVPVQDHILTEFGFQDVTNKPEVIIAGSGPAGLFSALRLIELGIKPVIIERGKNVADRKKDIALINSEHILDPESNYCFGEGGAGTFSDGKLYTRSKKKGNIRRIYDIFCYHGADEDILYDSHPHIGSDRLPGIITNIRKTILDAGGEIYFGNKVVDLVIKDNAIRGVVIQGNEKINCRALILATGHSAKDIYEMLYNKGVALESKPFAMGVRVEHPQELIDSIQYHTKRQDPHLPPALYNMKRQVQGRGVYTFCMCPGGYIIPSSTRKNEMVINGMSPSKRNSGFANAGVVVEIRPEDLEDYKEYGVLAGLKFRQKTEELAFINSGHGLTAPAQRMVDFVNGKLSASLPENSYLPGLASSPLHFWLPEVISCRLNRALPEFGKIMKGYLTNEAVLTGIESGTSSPVRIPRSSDTMEHIQIKGLFPCGEGAGYAGGIVSSAVDGQRVAEALNDLI